jgi:hypothetical protein
MLGRYLWLFGPVLALTFRSAPARADATRPASDAARAVEIGNEGIASFEQGRWLDALERFRAAEAHYHSPVFSLYAARSLRNAGRLLEAREAFRQLAGETLPASAPAIWKQAQNDGRNELTAIEAEIPSATISVIGGSSNTVLLLDGRLAQAGRRTELDPGVHRLIARDSGRMTVRDFVLARAAKERIVIRFEGLNVPPAATSSSRSAADDTASARLPGWILVGTGGAAIATGAVFGVLALQRKAEAEESLSAHCAGNVCPVSRRNEIDARIADARRLGTIADVFLIGGIGVAVAGTGVLIFSATKAPAVQAGVSGRGGVVRVRF